MLDESDITIIRDPVPHIRSNPRMYLGVENPAGRDLADVFVSMLLFFDATPIHIEKHEKWWRIAAGKKWGRHSTGPRC